MLPVFHDALTRRLVALNRPLLANLHAACAIAAAATLAVCSASGSHCVLNTKRFVQVGATW
jgi:hypothetical protein